MTPTPHARYIAARKLAALPSANLQKVLLSELAAPNFIAQPTPQGPVYICRARDGLILGRMNADLVQTVLDALNRAPLLQKDGPHG